MVRKSSKEIEYMIERIKEKFPNIRITLSPIDEDAEDEIEDEEYYPYNRNRYGYFPKSTPRQAKGGVKAQSKRGAFAASWWGKRWIEIVEKSNIGARLGRGKNYARKGQVLGIEIEKGAVKAKVQGSRRTPYSIKMEVKVLTKTEWDQVIETLSHQPIFMAKLLAGEMPDDIEYVFHDLALSLFPSLDIDIKTDCNCPDWSNPCKHIAAVFYLLGEEFDRDPFLIFRMRGITRDELLSQISKFSQGETVNPKPAMEEEIIAQELLPADETAFWKGKAIPADIFGELICPPIDAALPKRLGKIPFWQGKEMFADAMEKIYSQTSKTGMNVFLGEWNKDGAIE